MIINMDELRLLLNLRRDIAIEDKTLEQYKVDPFETFKDARKKYKIVEVNGVPYETFKDAEEDPVLTDAVDEETAKPVSGYVVVDLSKGWERVLHLEYPVTVFPTKEAAQAAIISTNEFENGQYTWSQNDFRVLPFNKRRKP